MVSYKFLHWKHYYRRQDIILLSSLNDIDLLRLIILYFQRTLPFSHLKAIWQRVASISLSINTDFKQLLRVGWLKYSLAIARNKNKTHAIFKYIWIYFDRWNRSRISRVSVPRSIRLSAIKYHFASYGKFIPVLCRTGRCLNSYATVKQRVLPC